MALHSAPSALLSRCWRVARPLTTLSTTRHQQRAQHACLATTTGGGPSLQPPDVRELARLANISVSDEEVAQFGSQIEDIVSWFGQLQEVDVEGVPPALGPGLSKGSALREDEAVSCDIKAELLQQAPDREGPFVKVPKLGRVTGE